MTNQESYYDWELALQSKPSQRRKKKQDFKKNNTLDIPDNEFKEFVKIWKRKNKIY
ncbi:MAG: hypothetical protein ACFFDH_20410 [Promethearchaeota archaeon]